VGVPSHRSLIAHPLPGRAATNEVNERPETGYIGCASTTRLSTT
jgi:hypothetical protein